MFSYEKKLQFPVNIKNPNPKLAQIIITQYGGPDGELGASLRYLSQRFSMPNGETRATLNDIGSEELAHLEMIGTMCHQLLQGADCEMLKKYGFDTDYVEHGLGVYPQNAGGVPFTASYIRSSSVATTASSRVPTTCSYTRSMTRLPPSIARGFAGKRVLAYLAGIIAINFILLKC